MPQAPNQQRNIERDTLEEAAEQVHSWKPKARQGKKKDVSLFLAIALALSVALNIWQHFQISTLLDLVI